MKPSTLAPSAADQMLDLARRAGRRVPAYAHHLNSHGVNIDDVACLAQLPITTKSDYLTRYTLPDLMWEGSSASAGSWSSTSGSTGDPTYFPRDVRALDDAIAAHGRILLEHFSITDQSTLVIDSFAMGPWIGGTYTYQACLGLRERGRLISVATPGVDVSAAVRNLSVLAPHYEKVVVAGYPPLVKAILDQAESAALAQDIHLLLAGEAIGENWRDHLLNRIGRPDEPNRVALIYGTAEAGVMGFETPLTVAVRRAARPGTELAHGLFGAIGTRLPTFVAVDPLRRLVEVDDGYLLFTLDNAMPLIRYRINDCGNVFSAVDLRDLLRGVGYDQLADEVDQSMDYVVLNGRTDVATTYYSSNIYPSQLAEAFDSPSVSDRVTGRFIVAGQADSTHEPVLRISVELTAGGAGDPRLASQIQDLCIASLMANNDEYRTLREDHANKTDPQISLHPYRTGAFAKSEIKHRYDGGRA